MAFIALDLSTLYNSHVNKRLLPHPARVTYPTRPREIVSRDRKRKSGQTYQQPVLERGGRRMRGAIKLTLSMALLKAVVSTISSLGAMMGSRKVRFGEALVPRRFCITKLVAVIGLTWGWMLWHLGSAIYLMWHQIGTEWGVPEENNGVGRLSRARKQVREKEERKANESRRSPPSDLAQRPKGGRRGRALSTVHITSRNMGLQQEVWDCMIQS